MPFDNIIIATSTMNEYSDSPWCEPNAPLFRDVFIMFFGDKMVSRFWESNIGIGSSWLVQAVNCHMTTHVVYVTKYKKCTKITEVIDSFHARMKKRFVYKIIFDKFLCKFPQGRTNPSILRGRCICCSWCLSPSVDESRALFVGVID
jgi:hypothetical protein